MGIDLSVLVPSVHSRYATFGLAIQESLYSQLAALSPADQERVEIIVLTDNKQMTLGHKRNVMVDVAQGIYVVHCDDDDRLSDDYIRTLLDATESGADIITFLVSVSLNGEPPKICRYSKDYAADHNTADGYFRLPNHICAVRRDLARKVSFPSIPYGEDSGYSKLLAPLLGTEHAIDRILYHYDYATATTEAQEHHRTPMRRRDLPPLVDVVMLSRADTDDLRAMTQHAVDTCIAGANSLPVNVTVLEQAADCHGVVTKYQHATTVHMPKEFNFNRFANAGARMGSADWIMVANNDLIFYDGWLHALLAVNHLVVSPRCPRVHSDVTENRVGDRTGQDFSGWCFMIRRSLWELIGGFDECVEFWTSDDVVIQQLKAVDVLPMLVATSTVEHLRSVTLHQTDDPAGELTWKQIDTFSRKYGSHALADSPEFQRWLSSR
jgi:hypothetical protein